MAMVEVPGGSAVGGRSNHDRRTTPFFLEGRLEKADRRARSGKNKSPRMTRPSYVSQLFISCLKSTFTESELRLTVNYILTIPGHSLSSAVHHFSGRSHGERKITRSARIFLGWGVTYGLVK
eukprot:scaffold17527_cov42-Cyclotella_meneghiniana.AAC.8